MTSKILARYVTKTGKDAVVFKQHTSRNGTLSFSWIGLFGAASGSRDSVETSIREALARRKGVTLAEGTAV